MTRARMRKIVHALPPYLAPLTLAAALERVGNARARRTLARRYRRFEAAR